MAPECPAEIPDRENVAGTGDGRYRTARPGKASRNGKLSSGK